MSGGAGTILVSAGEPSGDLHGAGVVTALRRRWPEAVLRGCGGPRMAAAGLTVETGIDRLSVLGFGDALASVPRHAALLARFRREAEAGRIRAAVLVDYPGFHLRLGQALRRHGVPVVQYVAPQLWAWRAGRVAQLRRAADQVAAILPFEEAWFGARQVPCRFVGHPLLDRHWPTPTEAREALGLAEGEPVLGIFPGSRDSEIRRHWPLFREIGHRLLAEGRCSQAIVAGTPGGYYPDARPIRIHRGSPDQVMAAATAALVKSGTTTLEAALCDTPMAVVYRAAPITHWIARRLLTVDSISLVNLVAEAAVVPEFWHLPIPAGRVADALRPLLDPTNRVTVAQREGLALARSRLGRPGAAERVADLVEELAGP